MPKELLTDFMFSIYRTKQPQSFKLIQQQNQETFAVTDWIYGFL